MRSPTFWHSLRFAAAGILHTVRTQRNARLHLLALILVTGAGALFRLTAVEWGLVFLVSGLVIAMETMNSAVEHLVDLVQPDPHPLAKIIKDAAAGAVLITALTAVVVGGVVFGPRVWALLAPVLGF